MARRFSKNNIRAESLEVPWEFSLTIDQLLQDKILLDSFTRPVLSVGDDPASFADTQQPAFAPYA